MEILPTLSTPLYPILKSFFLLKFELKDIIKNINFAA